MKPFPKVIHLLLLSLIIAVFISTANPLWSADSTSQGVPDSLVFHWVASGDTLALAKWLEKGGDPDIYYADYTLQGQETFKWQNPFGIPIPFRRAYLSRKTVHGINALHLAVMRNDTTIIGLLLDAGADIEAPDNDNNTPLLAAWMIQQDLYTLFQSPFSNQTMYVLSSESRIKWSRKNAFLYLNKHGADLSKLTASPEEILTRGTWFNMPEIMEIGLARGADVNVRIRNELCFDEKGDKQGEDDFFGRQLIHLAVKFNAIQAIEALIEHGAHLNTPGSRGRTPLIIAANSGEIEVVEVLLEAGVSPNSSDADGIPVLQHALRNASYDVVKLLVNKGASTDEFDLTDAEPLYWAIKKSNDDMIEKVLEWGFDPNFPRRNQKPPLHTAALNGDDELCNMLLDAGAKVDLRDAEGLPPLSYAIEPAWYIRYSTIRLLLERGADVNQTWGKGEGPLFAAAKHNEPELIQMLLDYGADIHKVDGDGKTAASYMLTPSIRYGTLKFLMEKGADFQSLDRNGWTIIHEIIRDKNRELLESVLSEDVSKIINCIHKKKSPLHMAVSEGDTVFARLLLQAGADPNVGLEPDELPYGHEFCFSIALANNDTAMVKMLFDYGARVYLGDKFIYERDDAELVEDVIQRRRAQGEILFQEQRAIYLAVAYNAAKCAQVLINEGVDFKAKNIHNQSPLWWAINYPGRDSLHLRNKAEVVELLLEKGANPDQEDHYHLNLLCHSCDSQAEWLVKLLLEAGANANVKQRGKPALHFAVEKGSVGITQMLIKHGADINAVDRKRKTAHQIAREVDNAEMVRLLENAIDANE